MSKSKYTPEELEAIESFKEEFSLSRLDEVKPHFKPFFMKYLETITGWSDDEILAEAKEREELGQKPGHFFITDS
jgi:hypothetical protein